ncbi:MAG: hypothetical protein FWH35_00490 [Treponema sp.]|nr:hypothetical protein [Treponema sp.]
MEKQPGSTLNLPALVFMGIAAAIANNGLMQLSFYFPKGLYMDTIFTVAAAFLGALIPGLISAVLTTAIYGLSYYFIMGMPYFWAWYFYILCSVIAVILVRLFVRLFPEGNLGSDERRRRVPATSANRVRRLGRVLIMLTTLSFTMCIVVSAAGGLISTLITIASNVVPKDTPPETLFRLGLIRQGFSLLPSEILGRIPVNLADKTIAVFGGYGIALLIGRAIRPKRQLQPHS